ncbi:MAG: prepilin-type N-terminal cleavage/methylation domain-containing protein [Verrucomicrobiales bacterium]|nr:prepilin-type N-terminal cleavage/methylation domain-containing protein [Verrucomicrobiales bacterium]MCP5556351.1 prepilin-type N-terminal cleavage/methylation domain-containing protein [Verrucomicrobiaceae bacterium]
MPHNQDTPCATTVGIALRETRSSRRPAFTLIEILAVLAVMSVLLAVTGGLFSSLGAKSLDVAADTIVGAIEQARSDAMRSGEPRMIAFREAADGFGKSAVREFGLVQSGGGTKSMIWQRLPAGAALWGRAPAANIPGTALLTLAQRRIEDFQIPSLTSDADTDDTYWGIVFNDLGEITFPATESMDPARPAAAGPYFIAVVNEAQLASIGEPKNIHWIEIRPATGRTVTVQ